MTGPVIATENHPPNPGPGPTRPRPRPRPTPQPKPRTEWGGNGGGKHDEGARAASGGPGEAGTWAAGEDRADEGRGSVCAEAGAEMVPEGTAVVL
jgi:hypothetical protein